MLETVSKKLMARQLLDLRVIAAVVAAFSMAWLLSNIDTHSQLIERNMAGTFAGIQTWVPPPPPTSEPRLPEAPGLDVVQIYECLCGYSAAQYGVGGWIGLWLVTFLVGGIPTAVLAHSTLQSGRAKTLH